MYPVDIQGEEKSYRKTANLLTVLKVSNLPYDIVDTVDVTAERN